MPAPPVTSDSKSNFNTDSFVDDSRQKLGNSKSAQLQFFEPVAPIEKYDVKTVNQGLFEITKYGLFIEEQNSGRYLFLNNEGEIIFEYINKSRENNKVYQVHWSRLITKKEKITKMRKRFNNE